MNELVSVIVPTYNRADYIKATILSILNQIYKNVEIIIIDDGSTDNTQEIICNINSEKIIYKKIENSGRPAVPRNIGIKLANGDYIAFCDSDDLWEPDKLAQQLNVFKNHKNILITTTNAIYFPGKKKKLYGIKKDFIISLKCQIYGNKVVNSAVVMKKEVLNHIGLINEDKKLFYEDYEYWLRLLNYKDNSIYFISKPLIKYRIHENMYTKSIESRYNSLIYLYEKVINYIKDNYKYMVKKQIYKYSKYLGIKPKYYENIKLFFKIEILLKTIINNTKIKIKGSTNDKKN